MRKAIIVVVVFGIAWLAIGRNQLVRIRYYDFEEEDWAEANRSERYFMAKYLVDTGMLIGKTRSEVLGLIGEADKDGELMVLYDLGPERGSLFAVDDDWLEIVFGGTGDPLVVQKTRVRPD